MPEVEVNDKYPKQQWSNFTDSFYFQILLNMLEGKDEVYEDSTSYGDPTDLDNLDIYDGGGGQGRGNTTGKTKSFKGIYKKCSLDEAGKKELAYVIRKLIPNSKWMKKICNYLVSKDAGFADVRYNPNLNNIAGYDPQSKVYEIKKLKIFPGHLGKSIFICFKTIVIVTVYCNMHSVLEVQTLSLRQK